MAQLSIDDLADRQSRVRLGLLAWQGRARPGIALFWRAAIVFLALVGRPASAPAQDGPEWLADDQVWLPWPLFGEAAPGEPDAGALEPRPLASPVAPVESAGLERRAVFDVGRPLGLAVFMRDDALWLVFAAEDPLNAVDLARQGELGLGTALIAEARGGVALRFDNPRRHMPTIDLDGTAWTILLADEITAESRPLTVRAEPNHEQGARLFIEASDPARPVAFVDSTVGDILVAMPLWSAGRGIGDGRRYAEFRLLSSVLGIVLRPSIEDLRLRGVDGGVAITSESGLQLS